MKPEDPPPLARARVHLERASSEAALGLRALLEGILEAGGLEDAKASELTEELNHALSDLRDALTGWVGLPNPKQFGESLNQAIELEIERWRDRAKDDPEAETVLHAFEGLQRLVRDFRSADPPPPPSSRKPQRTPSQKRTSARRAKAPYSQGGPPIDG